MHKFVSNIKGVVAFSFLVVHTIFWCIFMYILYVFKILSKNTKWRKITNFLLEGNANNWIRTNNLLMYLLGVKFELPDLSHLSTQKRYFITCNHQAWLDILILQKIFLKKTPFIRFFIKKELMWLPFLNLAWWAFDFPIMQRHSKEALKKRPELKDKDIQATQKACEKYYHIPVSLLNFLEGTRFTEQKHQQQQSKYTNLLNPKSGGFAYAINAMNKHITHVVDVTIAYPEGRQTFWDFLCGRVNKVIINIQEREIPSSLLQGDYSEDQDYRSEFQQWVANLWTDKDKLLNNILKLKPKYTFN